MCIDLRKGYLLVKLFQPMLCFRPPLSTSSVFQRRSASRRRFGCECNVCGGIWGLVRYLDDFGPCQLYLIMCRAAEEEWAGIFRDVTKRTASAAYSNDGNRMTYQPKASGSWRNMMITVNTMH